MNYFILIIVAIAGIALGMYLPRPGSGQVARRNKSGFISEPLDCAQGKQSEQKSENKQKILEFVQANGRVQNNDVGKLAGVSNATAERYLDELEKEGKLTQHGEIGQGVFYTPK